MSADFVLPPGIYEAIFEYMHITLQGHSNAQLQKVIGAATCPQILTLSALTFVPTSRLVTPRKSNRERRRRLKRRRLPQKDFC